MSLMRSERAAWIYLCIATARAAVRLRAPLAGGLGVDRSGAWMSPKSRWHLRRLIGGEKSRGIEMD